jgi:predicted phosphodiesterase
VKHLVLSDLHSNIEALRAVLEHAAPAACEGALVLGDIVGYGADPLAVIAAVRDLPGLIAVRGNHDRVAAGLDEGDDFNPPARVAAHWTRGRLTDETAGFLRRLPRGPLECAPGVLLSHGSPLDEDEYLLHAAEAARCFRGKTFALCFFGHTHLPCVFTENGGGIALRAPRGPEEVVALKPGHRYLVNPGSVGQPRDRVPMAGYAIYDPGAATVTFRRVPYAVAEARRKIHAAGLPAWLGDRLVLGA